MLPCTVWSVLAWIFNAYLLLLIVYALVSWIPSLRGRWTDYLGMVIEPVLTPVRRIIPPLGGLDLSFLVVFIVIQVVARIAGSEPCV
ncbi:MAG TPA: YggT family protein [Candidatus Elarobacter sp.]|jgi:YggT family protein